MTNFDTALLRRSLFSLLSTFAVSVALSVAAPAQAAPDTTPATAPATRNVQLAERAFTRGDAVPAWADQVTDLPPPIKGGAMSIRLADVQFRVDAEPVVYIHRALTANEASGLAALGQYEIEFQPEYQRVQLHSLRILRDGQVIDKLASADIRFLQRETNLDQGIYSGAITAAIVSEDVRAGDTLELSYSLIGQNPVFGGKFFDGGELASTEQHKNGRRILRFETRALAALLGESHVPSDATPYRWLQFSEFDSWRDIDRWAQGLFALPPATPALIDALREARAAPTQQQATAKVLDFVQNQIRYLSISMGENSHRPFPPAQVLQRRYGDCKDKSLLMVAMLRELGIEAQPVLVSTYYRKGLDRMLPSPALFDHAIVRARIQGKLYFFDPTRLGQYGALDRMGQIHAGAQVLAIGAAGQGEAALETIAAGDPEQIIDQRSEHVLVTQMDPGRTAGAPALRRRRGRGHAGADRAHGQGAAAQGLRKRDGPPLSGADDTGRSAGGRRPRTKPADRRPALPHQQIFREG
jgi:transglutaminase-like putative cysteine protease